MIAPAFERLRRDYQEKIVAVIANQIGTQGFGLQHFSGLAIDGRGRNRHAPGDIERQDTFARFRQPDFYSCHGTQAQICLQGGLDAVVADYDLGSRAFVSALAEWRGFETRPDIEEGEIVLVFQLAHNNLLGCARLINHVEIAELLALDGGHETTLLAVRGGEQIEQ